MLNEISANTSQKNIGFKSESLKTQEEKTQETVSKDKDKTEYIKLAGAVFAAALVASGGVALASKIINSKANSLQGLGIKKGDIKDELFNFLYRLKKDKNHKSTDAFRYALTKDDVLKLNDTLDEKTFSHFKKIAKSGQIDPKETIRIVENLNEHSCELIDQILQKHADDYNFKDVSISKILAEINEDNKEFAPKLIENAKKSYEDGAPTLEESLIDILKFVNKDNKKAFKVVADSHPDKPKFFSFEEMKEITGIIEEKKNYQSAGFFLDLKASNNTNYKFDFKDLKEVLPVVEDEKCDIYQKIFNSQSNNVKEYIPYATTENIEVIKQLQKLKTNENIDSEIKYFIQYANQSEAQRDLIIALLKRHTPSASANSTFSKFKYLINEFNTAERAEKAYRNIPDENINLSDYTEVYNLQERLWGRTA